MKVETPPAVFFPAVFPYAADAVDLPELLRRAAARDEKAWGILVERYEPFLWRLLKRFKSLTDEDRSDLSQKVFVILLDGALEQFRGSTDHEFRSYLWTITDNKAKRFLEKQSRCFEILDSQLPVAEDDNPDGFVGVQAAIDPAPGPEELVAEQEIRQQLRGCLAQIPLAEQEVFWLRERGASYKEISDLLEIPQPTAGTRYYRAKERIVACLRRAGVLS